MPKGFHDFQMTCDHGLGLLYGHLFRNALFKLALKGNIQVIKVITANDQLNFDAVTVLAGREIMEEITHLVVKVKVLMGIVSTLKDMTCRKMAVTDDKFKFFFDLVVGFHPLLQ